MGLVAEEIFEMRRWPEGASNALRSRRKSVYIGRAACSNRDHCTADCGSFAVVEQGTQGGRPTGVPEQHSSTLRRHLKLLQRQSRLVPDSRPGGRRGCVCTKCRRLGLLATCENSSCGGNDRRLADCKISARSRRGIEASFDVPRRLSRRTYSR